MRRERPPRAVRLSFLRALIVAAVLVVPFGARMPAAPAHRSGCHRWHTCPSDSGCYHLNQPYYGTCPGSSTPRVPTSSYYHPTTYSQPQDEGTNYGTWVFWGGAIGAYLLYAHEKSKKRKPPSR
jgi:hypothetical protein